jgi:hypothetical protein
MPIIETGEYYVLKSSMIYTLHKSDESEEDKMAGAWHSHGKYQKYIYNFTLRA